MQNLRHFGAPYITASLSLSAYRIGLFTVKQFKNQMCHFGGLLGSYL